MRMNTGEEGVGKEEILNMLVGKFPTTFFMYEARRRPLKLKIHIDILEIMDIDPAELSVAMRVYCSNVAYLRSCVEGAVRIDLNGDEAGVVTAEQAVNAQSTLTARIAAHKKRRTAREWEEAWARRAAVKPAPAKPAQSKPAQSKPEPKAQQESAPAARGLGFAGLREAARLRAAKKAAEAAI
jgi:ProP effector